jgi:hypothetical protein
MTRYRRRRLERGESVASAVSAAALGIGVAAAAYYVTRLFLAREPLADRRLPSRRPLLTEGEPESGTLTAGAGSGSDGPSPDEAGGHDPGA